MGLLSRRAFLSGLPVLQVCRAAGKGQQYPPEVRRFADPLTEREVWRLTDPSQRHFLPYSYQRFATQRNNVLLLGGERNGEIVLLRMELPSGRMVQVSQGPGVSVFSACFSPDERTFYYLQNGTLKQVNSRSLSEREIYRVPEGWWATGDLGISTDGRFAVLVEMKASDRLERTGQDWERQQWERKPLCRIRLLEIFKGASSIVVEEQGWLGRPRVRPKRDQVLYRHLGPWNQVTSRLWLVNLDGRQRQNIRPQQEGEEVGPEYWTADGKLIGYAHYSDRSRRRSTLRALNPDTREEQVLARCTQFWDLMGNSDNSAVVGESRSIVGPNIYVLFPLTDREITVCEHASSRKTEESMPRPAFSPDSQWIYYNSDRDGATAVYRAGVGDWVEKTD